MVWSGLLNWGVQAHPIIKRKYALLHEHAQQNSVSESISRIFCSKGKGRIHAGRQRTTPRAQRREGEVTNVFEEIDVDETDWIEVGIVGPPHGIRGEFKVQPLTDFPEARLGEPGLRWLQAPQPRMMVSVDAPLPQAVEIEWGRSSLSKGREVWLVKLAGINTPEDAAQMRGHRLLIPSRARPPLEDEDEFYVQDLVGLKVIEHSSGEEKGIVVDVMSGTGTHDVLRIKLHSRQCECSGNTAASHDEIERDLQKDEDISAAHQTSRVDRDASRSDLFVFLPFAKELVPAIDMDAGKMQVTPPEGLWDLAAPEPGRRRRKESLGKRERRRPRRSENADSATD